MKRTDLQALQISTRRSSLRRVCTLKVTLTHLNMSCARSCRVGVSCVVLFFVTGAPRSSEPLPAASAVQVSSIVHVPAVVSNTQDSGLQACFVITNPHSSARQRGLRRGGKIPSLFLHRRCALTCHTFNTHWESGFEGVSAVAPLLHNSMDMYRMSTAKGHDTATLHTSQPSRLC